MNNLKLAIFASGNGSNAEQIIRHFKGHPSIEVVAVFTNKPQAGVIQRARNLKIPVVVFNKRQFYEGHEVKDKLAALKVHAIILAGFLWLIPKELLHQYPDKILNIHPALLPKYGGAGMYGMHVHRAVLEAAEDQSGITIHLVNEKYDQGRIIFQAHCQVEPTETPDTLAQKVHALEHRYFPSVIEQWLNPK